jgi:hypothetical protein
MHTGQHGSSPFNKSKSAEKGQVGNLSKSRRVAPRPCWGSCNAANNRITQGRQKQKTGTIATANKHGKQICAYWMTSIATSVT